MVKRKGGIQMKLIIRTVTYPITFLIDLSIRLCALGIGIASALFGWISGLIGLGAAIVTLTGDWKNGLILFAIAFLVSPAGLPMIAVSLLSILQSASNFIRRI